MQFLQAKITVPAGRSAVETSRRRCKWKIGEGAKTGSQTAGSIYWANETRLPEALRRPRNEDVYATRTEAVLQCLSYVAAYYSANALLIILSAPGFGLRTTAVIRGPLLLSPSCVRRGRRRILSDLHCVPATVNITPP